MAKQTQAKIVEEAQKRFDLSQKFESKADKNVLADIKMANGDSYNNYQWPDGVANEREGDERPVLTINLIRTHNLLIENDAKKNKPYIDVKAMGFGASVDSAECYRALLDDIQNKSNAELAYSNARKFQIQGGIGWFRMETDFIAHDSFQQEIFIRPIYNPLAVRCDPAARLFDKTDANYMFLFEKLSKDEFKYKYPQYADAIGSSPLKGMEYWSTTGEIMIAVYYRKVKRKDVLIQAKSEETGQFKEFLESETNPEVWDMLLSRATNKRETEVVKIEQMTIAGSKLVEKPIELFGPYIPLIPAIGEELIIDNQLDRKGHTRCMIDSQKQYNYWASAGVEYGALQTKTPFIAPAESISEYQSIWDNANKMNFPVLPFREFDEDGNKLSAPQRLDPPVAAPVALAGMQTALMEMEKVSGQYSASMGETDNSRTGVAMAGRSGKSDLTTSHFNDNFATFSLTLAGKIALCWIPYIYTTEQVRRVVGPDAEEYDLTIDPNAKAAFEKKYNEKGEVIARVLNPKLGRYEVKVVPGEAFATRREQAFSTFSIILTQAPQLIPIIGDILFRAGDFPMAGEAAKRLRRMVPKEALGEGPSAMESELQAKIQQVTTLLEEAMKAVTAEKLKLEGVKADKSIEMARARTEAVVSAFKALTDRLKVVVDAKTTGNMTPEQVNELVQQSVTAAMETHLAESKNG